MHHHTWLIVFNFFVETGSYYIAQTEEMEMLTLGL